MLEIEQKYRVIDHSHIQQAVKDRIPGWTDRVEVDHYFNAPDRDFAQTHEAFRLRRVGEVNFLTYKGPRMESNVKIRTELETAIAPGDRAAEEMTQLLTHLGYKSVAVIRKQRKTGGFVQNGFPVTICLDSVDSLGTFAEVEIISTNEDCASATTVLLEVAESLDLREVEPRSYLRLFLEQNPF